MNRNIKIMTPKTSKFSLELRCAFCKAPRTLMLSLTHMLNSKLCQPAWQWLAHTKILHSKKMLVIKFSA
jgi:hypothetical protein